MFGQVFVLCVPQSLAYGQLSGLGAVFGLYTSTFPLFVYFVLGSSRHLSIGTRYATRFNSKYLSNE